MQRPTASPVLRCLTRARAALCPTCGATLPLSAEAARVACAYCGEDAVVERRLRTVEAELVAGTDAALVARPPAPWVPAHALAKGGREQGQCPTCAAPIEADAAPDHFDCAHCGARAKVERRLAPDHGAPYEAARFDAELEAFRREDASRLEDELRLAQRAAPLRDAARFGDELVDLRVRRMLAAGDDAELARAAAKFEPWSELTPWRELALARLMERASASAAAEAALVDGVIARVAAAAWQYDERRAAYVRGVVRAAGRVLFAPRRSAKLLDALGFAQPAAMLKLLLEAAEWALAHGHAGDAEAALAAAGASLDFRRGQYHVWRDKVDRTVVGEVILYRLLYLTPPLLAWALDQLPRWQAPDLPRAARFMDDCALERPELAPLLLDAGLLRLAPLETFAEYAAHLALVSALETDAARLFALRARTFAPDGFDPNEDTAPVRGMLDALRTLGRSPLLADEVGFELARLFAEVARRDLPAVHDIARAAWAELPEHPRAVYARFVRDPRTPRPGPAAHEEAHLAAPQLDSDLARAVAAHRGRIERDYEATRVDDDLDDARLGARLALADVAKGARMAPEDNAHYIHDSRLHATWLGYRATRDPRFKQIIAVHERALADMTV